MTIFDLFRRYGVEVKENYSDPDEFKICCLFCGDRGHTQDFKFRLGFNVSSGEGHCFNCGWASRKVLLEIVRKLGASGEELLAIKNQRYTRKTRVRPKIVELPEGFQLLKDVDESDILFGEAKKYIKDRGITDRQIREHEIGATISGWYSYRIIFPVRNTDGELFGLVARDWTGKKDPKYLNSLGTKYTYNADPKKYPTQMIILAEGIVKALAIERAVRNKICCASTLNNSCTDVQREAFKDFKEVVLFCDPDKDGITGYMGVANFITPLFPKVTVAWPLPEKQADDLTPEEIRLAIRGRKLFTPLLDLKVRRLLWNR